MRYPLIRQQLLAHMSLAPMPMAVPKAKMTVSAKIHVYSAGADSCDSLLIVLSCSRQHAVTAQPGLCACAPIRIAEFVVYVDHR
jgi:hypothetical protein